MGHRQHIWQGVAVAGVLVLPACASGASGTPDTDAPSDVGAPATSATTAVAQEWRLTADSLDLAGAAGPVLTDPTNLTTLYPSEGSSPNPAAVITAGDVLVTAARPTPSFAEPAVLVGIGEGTGAVAWTYQPAEGQLLNCAPELLGGNAVCLVGGVADEASDLVLIDPATGEQGNGFALSGRSDTVAVVGEDAIALVEVETFRTYEVVRYSADGEVVWSSPIDITGDVAAMDAFPFAISEPGTGQVKVQILNVLLTLDAADGTVVSRGSGELEVPAAAPVEISGGREVSVDASGALVATPRRLTRG